MTTSVLDRADQAFEAGLDTVLDPTLGLLHDSASKVDDELLPCRVNNPELWFAESPSDVEFAKALCQGCPVQAMCLDGALARREPWGVWGGELFLQGTVIPRKRPRGGETPGPRGEGNPSDARRPQENPQGFHRQDRLLGGTHLRRRRRQARPRRLPR